MRRSSAQSPALNPVLTPFPEAILEIEQYQQFANALDVPILANIAEFGKTPLFNCETLGKAGVAMVLTRLAPSEQ